MKILKIIVTSLILHSTSLIAADSAADFSLTLERLKKNPAAEFHQKDGWSIVSLSKNDNRVIWFFSPEVHAAHPAVIKKIISVKDGEIETEITTLCDAGKKKCDDLIKQFKAISDEYK